MKHGRPHVLLICTDHWPGGLLGCLGHPAIQTPTLDQLAALGINFTNAYSACPVCIPARRSLMTGLSARAHGDRNFDETRPMPQAPSLPQCFRDAGYQTFGVGKLHVYPQRNRIGFEEILINEEGRNHLGGGADDWQLYLAEHGFFGQEDAGGGANNDYLISPWHLPSRHHPTNWTAREMCRLIKRLDPTRPAFLYASFTAPHPPLWTLPEYESLYSGVEIDGPVVGSWVPTEENRPYKWKAYFSGHAMRGASDLQIKNVRRAFYSMITHVDRQIRVILGALRSQHLLENTIILFTSDHGDMLGDHGLWAKGTMYEQSAGIPMILVPASNSSFARGVKDARLAELRDVMPTLLEMSGLPIPDGVEGKSLIGKDERLHLYGEHGEGVKATRMIRRGDYKLIYYAEGNLFQLFDVMRDPKECEDLAHDPEKASVFKELKELLAREFYGGDSAWTVDGEWVGLEKVSSENAPLNFQWSGQRGIQFP